MPTVYSRPRKDGTVTWYTKVRTPTGGWRPIALRSAKTERQANKLADEIAREDERRNLGLEPGALFRGTFGELCEWYLKVHAKHLGGAREEKSRLTHHIIGKPELRTSERPAIGKLPAEQITSAKLETWFSEVEDRPTRRGKPPSPSTINRLRLSLSAVFSAAHRHGLWGAENPARKTQERDVPERSYETLAAHEIAPVLAEVPDYWRGCCAVALLTGLRKGEIFGLKKADVDLEHRLLHVRRSHQRETTKGGHVGSVPIHEGLVSYIEPWLKSPTPWLFPDTRGKQRSRNLHTEKILRAAMVRAGIVEGYRHKCRRRGCGFVEEHPDAAPRDCPECGMRLWPSGVPRAVRFHDARHTLATQALLQGASLQGVQAILRHKDPRLTIQRYGHLTRGFLQDEVNRVHLPGIMTSVDEKSVQSSAADGSEPRASRRTDRSLPAADRGASMVRGVQGVGHRPENREEIELNEPAFFVEPTGIEPVTCALRKQAETIAAVDSAPISSTFLAIEQGSSSTDSAQIDPSREVRGASMVHGVARLHQGPAERTGHPLRPDPAQLLTVRQVAERLSVSQDWVYRQLKAGVIPPVRVGAHLRVHAEALDAYLAGYPGIAPPAAPVAPAEPEAELQRRAR